MIRRWLKKAGSDVFDEQSARLRSVALPHLPSMGGVIRSEKQEPVRHAEHENVRTVGVGTDVLHENSTCFRAVGFP